jgi:hypothetical protein
MTDHAGPLWRERLALRYLDAHDAGDLDTIAALWEQAGADPELEHLLRELEEGLAQEMGLGGDWQADAARVLALARRHLPSAFPPEEPRGPLTASDVARQLEAEPEFRRLGPADRAAHARLLADATPLPEALGQPPLDAWLRDLGVAPGPVYRRAFRKVAVLLDMARCQQEGRLAAARRAGPGNEGKGGRP